jgi:hypothetical protein
MVDMRAKYAHLLNDDDIRRWYENLAAKSIITATVYLRTLGLYCEINRTDPKLLLKTAKTKEFRDKFSDFVRGLEREGKAGSYIAKYRKVLHSWLSYNGLNIRLRVNIAGEYDTPTIADERIPNKDELDKIIRTASRRGRVSASLMAFGGIRPESLGNYTGTDGIKLGDFSEVELKDGKVNFLKIPAMITIRKGLSKTKHQYFTFIPEQGITYVKEYLEERIRYGEKLEPDTPLLGFDARGVKRNKFLRTTLVTRDIKEAISKAGFRWRPYVLRAYFDTNMIIAESKGRISHPYVQFMMGHKGDMDARYSTNKGVLPPDMIEDMRKCYKECEPFLTTVAQPLEQSSIVKEAKIEALKSVAKTMFGIDLMDVKIAKERELGKEMSPDEQIELFENEVKRLREAPDPQKVIGERELERYLNQGWQFVMVLPSKRIVIKK